jgi:hypothetical protein
VAKEAPVANVTLALDDQLLQSARRYANEHGTSLNELIRRQLEQVVAPPTVGWFESLEDHVAHAGGRSSGPGRGWTREELYEDA